MVVRGDGGRHLRADHDVPGLARGSRRKPELHPPRWLRSWPPWTGALPADAQVLDIACGPGMQTLALADLLPRSTIVAVDAQADFGEEGKRGAISRGVSDRVELAQGDMVGRCIRGYV